MEPRLITIQIDKPEPVNFILGQTHFIKSVEDLHETLVTAVPGIKFGLAFCEASGKCLIRWSGTDPAMVELARKNALAIGAGQVLSVFFYGLPTAHVPTLLGTMVLFFAIGAAATVMPAGQAVREGWRRALQED